jgi:hypothetical protein
VGSQEVINANIVKLTKQQEAILVGTVLGDAYLQKTGTKNARLRFEHSGKQKEYVIWKTKAFPKFFQGKPSELKRKHPKTNKIYSYVRHQSSSSPILGKWREIFYQDGKKQIPKDLPSMLTNSLSLAVWYMDDGYYYERDKVSYIYLGRVNETQAQIAQEAIKKNFNLNPRILDKKSKGFVLYFSPQETKHLHDLLRKDMLPMFDYKLN